GGRCCTERGEARLQSRLSLAWSEIRHERDRRCRREEVNSLAGLPKCCWQGMVGSRSFRHSLSVRALLERQALSISAGSALSSPSSAQNSILNSGPPGHRLRDSSLRAPSHPVE